jgi:hypothetical protein
MIEPRQRRSNDNNGERRWSSGWRERVDAESFAGHGAASRPGTAR